MLIHGYTFSQCSYKILLDSAEFYCYKNPLKAIFFLKKIPKPLDKSIAGNLAKYYQLHAIINHLHDERAEEYYNYFLSLKYARNEYSYDVAGAVCTRLCYNIYSDFHDSKAANKYLALAKKYFTLSKNKVGLLEVSQFKAYKCYVDKNYAACRDLILPRLDSYRVYNSNDSKVLFQDLLMLIQSELQLHKLKDAYRHYSQFQRLVNTLGNENIVYDEYLAEIQCHLAWMYTRDNKLDSARSYVKMLGNLETRSRMFYATRLRYYAVQIGYCQKVGNLKESRSYMDSLSMLQNEQIKKNLRGSYLVQKSVLDSNHKDGNISEKRQAYYFMLIIITLSCITAFSAFYYHQRKKSCKKRFHETDNNQNIRLAVKIKEMELYIKNLKVDIKNIYSINDKEEQGAAIRQFYRKLQIDSARLFDQTDNLLLVNQIRSDFTIKLRKSFPTLDDQDIIICHYVYTGLLNKEIATYMNQTIRSVEGKRYRISKKMGLIDKGIKLADFLQQFFQPATDKGK